MMCRSGLRPEEIVALARRDLDVAAGRVVIRSGCRTASRRTTGVDRGTLGLVTAWLDLRRARGLAAPAPLFCTLAGAPLSSGHLRQLTSRLAGRAGVSARAHPMALRHAGAAELAEEGVPEPTIDRHLGLAPPRTLPGARPVPEDDVVRAIAGRSWEIPSSTGGAR